MPIFAATKLPQAQLDAGISRWHTVKMMSPTTQRLDIYHTWSYARDILTRWTLVESDQRLSLERTTLDIATGDKTTAQERIPLRLTMIMPFVPTVGTPSDGKDTKNMCQ
jgi:hypothetical protein